MEPSFTKIALAMLASTFAACGGSPEPSEDLGTQRQAASSAWAVTALSGQADSAVAVATRPTAPGTPIDLFYVYQRQLFWRHHDTIVGWQPPILLANYATGAPGIVVFEPDTLVLYWNGFGGQLCTDTYSAGAWRIGSCSSAYVMAPDSGVTALFDQNYVLFWRGTNGNMWRFDIILKSAVPPVDTGIPIVGTPSAVARPSIHQRNVFYRGTNGHLYDSWFDGATWHPGWDHGIAISTDPSAVVSGNDARIDVYYGVFSYPIYADVLSRDVWTPYTGWSGGASLGVRTSLSIAPAGAGAKQAFLAAPWSGQLEEADDTTLY
jgi:hypothetical protein